LGYSRSNFLYRCKGYSFLNDRFYFWGGFGSWYLGFLRLSGGSDCFLNFRSRLN